MSKQDWIGFLGAGLAAWTAVTLFYAAFSGGLLESAFWFYSLNAFLAAGAMSSAFHATERLRRVSRHDLMAHTFAFVAPGLIGGALLVSRYDAAIPAASPGSAGRYALFVLVCYAAAIAQGLETRRKAARVRIHA